jgi:hypothetical protein
MNGVTALALPLCALALAAHGQDKVNQTSLIFKDFDDRIAEYVKVHKSARSRVPALKPTKTPAEIQRYEHGLAREIRKMRSSATQGSIFTPEIAAQIRLLIVAAMGGSGRIQKSLKEAEPVWLRSIRVNAAYPSEVPLQSSPPSLLINLPKLPPEVEYRVVGSTMILRDVEANLIVDFMRDAIP